MKKTIITTLLTIIWMTGQAQPKTVVWEHPATEENTEIEGFFSTLLEINRVEFDKDETRVMMHVALRPLKWVRFVSETYLKADGKRYALKSCDGIELDKNVFLTDHGCADVVFHFEPLPAQTKCFDFIEGDGQDAFKLLGVEDIGTRASRLFPSNWRNDQTGDWTIGFYDDFAIYDCQFWNYKEKRQKGDKYMLVLENGGKEVTVNVDKNKNGQRTISIDGTKGLYSVITSITLPDYPQKDDNPDFKDSRYVTDTVTFVGWLKDMPDYMKKMGDEYNVSYTDILSDKYVSSYGKIDSLGRFVVKIPLLNSSEVTFDWKHTYIRTLFEPGETYFLLYDYKGGHKLFMGKNSRLQNETLAFLIPWNDVRPEEDMDEATTMRFLNDMKAETADNMKEVENWATHHPHTSTRTLNYLRGHNYASEGRDLMQGRFNMKDRKVPAEFLGYVGFRHWQQRYQPYTLYRDFSTFVRDFVDQLVEDKYATKLPQGFFIAYTDMEAPTLRHYKDEGKLTISDEDLDAVERFAKNNDLIHLFDSEDAAEKWEKEFESRDYVKRYRAITAREDVQQIIKKEYPLFSLYHTLNILDSIGCDSDLRDIIITNHFYKRLDHDRQPLSDFVMQYIDDQVSLPSAKSFLHAEQQKYLDIQRKDLSKSQSLKSAEDVANMSDGEKMLRKITEPYRGKLILLDIWGTWCAPCKAALAKSKEEYERLKAFDLVYLYLANRSGDEAWKNVIKEYDLLGDNIVHYNLPEAQQSAIENFLQVQSFPTYKLIDRNGNVLDVNADPRDLEGLARLLENLK
ncbi:MAG: thioredoxin family protein [Bacteroidaceae bacterium]|nr:thioredoxin family protein [Bacteroidaceae bacterium]